MIREKQFNNRYPIASQSVFENIKIIFVSTTKLGQNTNNVLNNYLFRDDCY